MIRFSGRRAGPGLVAALGAAMAVGTCAAADFSSLNVDFLGRLGAPQGMVALPATAANVVGNPSGLALIGALSGEGFSAYMDYLAGTRGATAGYVWSMKPGRGYGAYISYLTSGSLAVTTWSDPVGGDRTFSYGGLTAGLAGGTRLCDRFLVGAGVKLARDNLDEVTASGAFLDIGGMARLAGASSPDRGAAVYLGIVGRNLALGTWGEESGGTDLAIATEVGLSAASPSGASSGISVAVGRQGRREVRLGVAARLSGEFEARIGWRRRIGTGSDTAFDFPWQRGLSAGFGVSLGRFWLDYTYEDESPLDAIHRFALRAAIRPVAQPD
jgi:hypothetical protein